MDETSPGTMLADRAVLRICGENVVDFLQGLVTNDVALLRSRPVIWTGLLTPQGKALFDFMMWQDGEDVLIDCESNQSEALARRLSVYRLRRAIGIEPTDIAVHWSRDTNDGIADPRLDALGHRWLGRPGPAASGWQAHRLGLGVTEGVNDLGAGETLWLECNARELNGVSFSKGCYVGQENTARMHHRGRVNRRLVVAPLAGSGPRTRAVYPGLGQMVELRRVDDLGDALRPGWFVETLQTNQETN